MMLSKESATGSRAKTLKARLADQVIGHQSKSGNPGSGEGVDLSSGVAQKPVDDGVMSQSEICRHFVSQDFSV